MSKFNEIVSVLRKKGYKKMAATVEKVIAFEIERGDDKDVIKYLTNVLEDYTPNTEEGTLGIFIEPESIKSTRDIVKFFTSDEDGNEDNEIIVEYDVDWGDTFKVKFNRFKIKKSDDKNTAKAMIKALKNNSIDEELDPKHLDNEIKDEINKLVKSIVKDFQKFGGKG